MVRDVSGAVLPGATVTARHVESGLIVERVTDNEGRFFLPALRTGILDDHRGAGRLRATNPGRRGAGTRRHHHGRVPAGGRRDHRERHRSGGPDPPADPYRRDQRRDREPPGGAVSAQRPQLPGAGAAQRRRRAAAGRHARRRAATGGAAAQRRRTTLRPQHLSAGRRQGHRRTVQQPGDQPLGGFDPGVQDPEVDVPGGVRRQGVGADQRRDQGRRQPVPRQRVRVPSQRCAGCPQLLRRAHRAGAAAQSEPVRRIVGGAAGPRSRLLLRQLRGAANEPVADQDILGAIRRRAFRQLRRIRADLRPGGSWVHAVCEQPDPGRANRSDCRRVPEQRAAGHLQRAGTEPDVGRGIHANTQPDQRTRGPSADRRRPAVRPVQHVRRRRAAALRHQRPARGAGAGFRPDAGHDDAEPDGQPHARLRAGASERAALRLHARGRRPGKRQCRRGLRRPGRAGRRDQRPARRGLPADHDPRALQHDGRSRHVRLPAEPALRAV